MTKVIWFLICFFSAVYCETDIREVTDFSKDSIDRVIIIPHSQISFLWSDIYLDKPSYSFEIINEILIGRILLEINRSEKHNNIKIPINYDVALYKKDSLIYEIYLSKTDFLIEKRLGGKKLSKWSCEKTDFFQIIDSLFKDKKKSKK